MKKWYGVVVISMVMAGTVFTQEISADKESKLTAINLKYVQKEMQVEGQIQTRMSEIALELTRKGRLDSEKLAKEAATRVNVILTDVGALYGEFIKIKVEHMLAAKNVLTLDQKLELLSQLEPAGVMNYGEADFLQPDIFDLPIHLNLSQRKKLIKLEADLLVKEVKLERDIALALLEIETELLAETIDSAKVDKQAMELAKLAGKAIENRVKFILDAKDELTLEQKRIMADLMGIN